MPQSRRPTRRDGKAVRSRPKTEEPNDDSALAILRRQFERLEAQRSSLELVLGEEKEARAAEAMELGEMMARLSLAEGRTLAAQAAAEELAQLLEEERRQASEREARQALVRTELESLRNEAARRPRTDAPPRSRPSASSRGEVEQLRRELDAARGEGARLRESLAALQRRAAQLGAGFKEMRELMVQSAALFDELEERERAIGEIRARSLRDARTLFLKAAGRGDEETAPAKPPAPRPMMEDLSDAAELLEEEVRASLRPRRDVD